MKPKGQKNERRDWLNKVASSLGEVVDERWWVEEYRPRYNTGGYYDQDIPEMVIEVSKYFKTEAEAVEYMNSVEPTLFNPQKAYVANKLRIRHQKCYERLERRWI